MSIELKSGTSAAIQDVDAVSKAARAALYDFKGNVISPGADAGFSAPIKVRQTTTTGAGAIVWALRNSHATKIVVIERMVLQMFFDGTGAATLMQYDVAKYITTSAMNGGAVAAAQRRTSQGAPAAATEIEVLDTGITLTGGALQGVIAGPFACARATPAATVRADGPPIPIIQQPYTQPFELAQNEVLVVRNGTTAVAGDNCNGFVEWTER